MPPLVSTVLPTRNRLSHLRTALKSLVRQAPPGLMEIIVVDDGSSDGTPDYLAGLAREGLLVHLRTKGRGAAAARNAGICEVRTPFVAFTDDDCVVPQDWAARLAARLERTGAAAVGGRLVTAPDAPLPARISQAITNGLVKALNPSPDDAAFLTSNSVAYRVEALQEVGLFDESFTGAGGEERELHARLMAAGKRLVYAPDIVVQHRPALDWRGFLRQQVTYGKGARLCYRRAAARDQAATRTLSPDTYRRMIGAALREVAGRDRPALMLGLLVSQAAVAWGYLRGPE